MKIIPLTQGKAAVVDDEDFSILSKYKWHYQKNNSRKTGYAIRHIRVGGRKGRCLSFMMHREILGLQTGDAIQCDHIDGDGLNNRRGNLRKCTQAQNQWNTPARNGREIKGVYWEERHKSWKVSFRLNGKIKNFGRFKNKNDAINSYNEIVFKERGSYAKINVL
jgi:hypothetical protein